MAPVINCWDFLKCGREPGGLNVEELGVCPAATSTEHDGINRGVAAGRFCWIVEGTLCSGKVVNKFVKCTACNFYKLVKEEEGVNFQLTPQFFR